LPIRDEIIYSYFPAAKDMEVLEIGPGSGFSALRFSRLLKHLTVAEVGRDSVAALRPVFAPVPNIDLIEADICDPLTGEREGRNFDAVEAVEVFEFLPDPRTALRNMAKLLRPGGLLFLQFPNYAPPKNPGVTFVESRAELDSMLHNAGFCRHKIFAIQLRSWAGLWYRVLHEIPLQVFRALRQGTGTEKPQVYHQTWAFRERHCLRNWKVILHLYWDIVMAILRLGGDCFRRIELHQQIANKNLLVMAWRAE
jgi:SAM-dependent methyltransferase